MNTKDCKTCKTTKLLYAVPCFCIKAAVTSLDTAYLWFQKKSPKHLKGSSKQCPSKKNLDSLIACMSYNDLNSDFS